MINLNNLVRKITILTIILSTTDIIRILSDNISLFRISLLTASVFALIVILYKHSIRKGRYLYLSILLMLSPIAYFISTNKGWAFSFMLNDYMGVLLIFLICNFFDKKDTSLLLKAFIYSQFLTVALSVLSVFMYYFGGGIAQEMHFFGVFSIKLGEDFLRRATASGYVRLALPYSTPPHLSIIMAISVCILIFQREILPKQSRIILGVSLVIILFLTNSRTGFVSAFLAFFIVILFQKYKTIDIKKFIAFVSVMMGIILLFFIILPKIEFYQIFMNRLKIETIVEDRHFLVPLEGIIIWLSGLKNFILGIGYGSSINLSGKYTYLPPYFLNSYVTLVAEKGIIGFLIMIELFNNLIKGIKRLRNTKIHFAKVVFYSYIIAMISFVFYEAKQNISIWIIIAITLLLNETNSNNKEATNDQ